MPAFDAFVVSDIDRTVTRKCPFCDAHVEDFRGESVNFIAHLPSPTPKHQEKKEWADYVASLGLASESKGLRQ